MMHTSSSANELTVSGNAQTLRSWVSSGFNYNVSVSSAKILLLSSAADRRPKSTVHSYLPQLDIRKFSPFTWHFSSCRLSKVLPMSRDPNSNFPSDLMYSLLTKHSGGFAGRPLRRFMKMLSGLEFISGNSQDPLHGRLNCRFPPTISKLRLLSKVPIS